MRTRASLPWPRCERVGPITSAATFSAAQQLYRSDKPQEALPLIEEAVRLAPSSADVRYLHWQILNETAPRRGATHRH